MVERLLSLRKQLTEAEENLRLIKERKAEYVQETDIPLQLVKEERHTREKIADLRQRVGNTPPVREEKMETGNKRYSVAIVIAVIGMCGATIAALIGIGPDVWKLVFPTTAPPAPTQVISTPVVPPSVTPSSFFIALSISDLRPTATGCTIGGSWWVDLWVQPEGGNDEYTYYIDGAWQAGPAGEGVTIHLTRDSCTAMVGTMTVESGGQVESREFFIDVPDCCGQ